MPDLIWSFDELTRFTKWDDPEVRHWAIDRLIRHYPNRCCDVIADYVLDDHESTPTMVASSSGIGRHRTGRNATTSAPSSGRATRIVSVIRTPLPGSAARW